MACVAGESRGQGEEPEHGWQLVSERKGVSACPGGHRGVGRQGKRQAALEARSRRLQPPRLVSERKGRLRSCLPQGDEVWLVFESFWLLRGNRPGAWRPGGRRHLEQPRRCPGC